MTKPGVQNPHCDPVLVDKCLLNGMQPTIPAAKMLHGDHVATIERSDKPNTGIDRLINQSILTQPSDQHRAGATVTFGAAFFGTLANVGPVEDSRATYLMTSRHTV